MITAKPVPREDAVRAWQEYRAPGPGRVPEKREKRPLNLSAVLDIGTTIFFTFRGRAYGIPPLGWKAGQAILDAYLEARELGAQLDDRAKVRSYRKAFGRLSRLLWKNTRSVGSFRRVFRFLGLVRNPYLKASEGEIAELATFFLARRTTSRGFSMVAPLPPEQLT